jgi:DNA-directed RNA polymerase subunit M/transcription elongation factor TFIIS
LKEFEYTPIDYLMNDRVNAITLFYNKLLQSKHFCNLPELARDIATQLEYSILLKAVRETNTSTESYHTVEEFQVYYHSSVRYIATHLVDKPDNLFLFKLANGNINASSVINLEPQDIDITPLQQHIDKLTKQDGVSLIFRTSSYLKCSRCHSPCASQEFQKRSLDEAANVMLTCPSCGNVEMR